MCPGKDQHLPWEQQDALCQPGRPRVCGRPLSQPSARQVRFLFSPGAREGAQRQQRVSNSRRNSRCPGRGGWHQLANWVMGEKQLRCPGMDQTQVKQMDSGSFVGFLNENKIHFMSDLSNQSVLLC